MIADSFSGAADNSTVKSESQSQARTMTVNTAAGTEVAIGNAIRRRLNESRGLLPTTKEVAGDGGGDRGSTPSPRTPRTPRTPLATGGVGIDGDGVGDGGGENSQQPLLSHTPPLHDVSAANRRASDDGTGAVRPVSVHDDIRDEVTARKQRLSAGLRRRFSSSDSEGGTVMMPLRARAIIHDAAETAAQNGDGAAGSVVADAPSSGASASTAAATAAATATATATAEAGGKAAESRLANIAARRVASRPKDRTAWVASAPKDYSRIIGGSAKVTPVKAAVTDTGVGVDAGAAVATLATEVVTIAPTAGASTIPTGPSPSAATAATAPSLAVAAAPSGSVAAAPSGSVAAAPSGSVVNAATLPADSTAVLHAAPAGGDAIVLLPPVRFPGERRQQPSSSVEMTPVMSPSGVGVAMNSPALASPHVSIAATSVSTLSNRTVPGVSRLPLGAKSVDGGGIGLGSAPSVVPE